MDLTPHANDHSIYLPGRTGAAQDSHYHLFYITGNPGCIAYYHTFLTLLQEKVLFQKDGVSLSIYGESLPNFTDQATGPASILSLRQVIAHVGQRLVAYGQAQQKHTGQKSPIKIVISGHSLGTYIGLELLRWWHAERLNSTSAQTINIVGYLGLWCTVTWLNKSPSGRLAKVCCLKIVHSASLTSLAANQSPWMAPHFLHRSRIFSQPSANKHTPSSCQICYQVSRRCSWGHLQFP